MLFKHLKLRRCKVRTLTDERPTPFTQLIWTLCTPITFSSCCYNKHPTYIPGPLYLKTLTVLQYFFFIFVSRKHLTMPDQESCHQAATTFENIFGWKKNEAEEKLISRQDLNLCFMDRKFIALPLEPKIMLERDPNQC